MIKLGFASAILPDENFDEVVAIAADIGYRCVEMMCWPPTKAERRYSGITHIDIASADDASIGRMRQTLETRGVEISALGYYPNPLAADEATSAAAAEHLQRLIEFAPRMGVRTVTTFIGRDPARSVEDNWPRMLKTWRPIVDAAEKHDVRIAIENCPMLFSADEWPGGKNLATSPAIWRRLFADLGSPNLGLNYDPSHMVWQRMDYLKPIIEFAERIFHMHAKDVRVDREKLDDVGILAHPLLYHTPKLPGLGEVDWGRFFSVLGDVGYRGPVCVEVEDRAFEDSLASRKRALKQSATFLRNFLPRAEPT